MKTSYFAYAFVKDINLAICQEVQFAFIFLFRIKTIMHPLKWPDQVLSVRMQAFVWYMLCIFIPVVFLDKAKLLLHVFNYVEGFTLCFVLFRFFLYCCLFFIKYIC